MDYERRFRRPVLPFDGIEVHVDLQEMITSGRAEDQAPYEDVAPLGEWIDRGEVDLLVVSPYHVVPRRYLGLLRDAAFLVKMSGGEKHRPLCALAALYLHVLGKRVRASGDSACSYAGGWADVCAIDGSMFVECGTLNPQKPVQAMLAGQSLMVLPYTLGCAATSPDVIARLDPFPERCVEDFDDSPPRDPDLRRKCVALMQLARIRLGFIFVPRRPLRGDGLR